MTSTPADVAPPSASILGVLSDIASRVASDDEVVAKIRGVLEAMRAAVEATECSLWLHGAGGLVCGARAGAEVFTAGDVAAALDAPEEPAGTQLVRQLSPGGKRLGAIALRSAAPVTPEHRQMFGLVAELVGPELARAERLRQLKTELDVRTRQIDDERRFTQKIIDSLPVGLYVIDADYRIHAWNRNRETGMQGVSRDEAIGKTIFEILHRQPAEMLRREFDDVFATGRLQQFNIESRATGRLRTYRITKIPMRLNDGAITHVISIGEDISDWAEAQDRFAQSEKLAAIGQLAAGIMHEINNPLATILACAESLALRLDDMRAAGVDVEPQTAELLRIIDNEVNRCKHIIDGVLDFSRPKSAEKHATDVNAMIEKAIFLIKHHTRFKTVRVHTLLDAGLEKVTANAEQLVQVFMALLINAVDAMGEQGNITIRTRRAPEAPDSVVAEVIDEGHGIERAELPKIFEPFYTTKPPGRGTGLGLSICYAIIADHRGRIEVDSAVGAGSTFRIVLPRIQDAA
jgi:two-component system NtrC family sensor kinase